MPYKDKDIAKLKYQEYYQINKEIIKERSKLRYESTKVLKERNPKVKNCLVCNKEFKTKGDYHKKPRKYCSRECYNSEVSKRMKNNIFCANKIPWNKGLELGPLSEEHKNKIREKSLQNGNKPPVFFGVDHPNWVFGNYKKPEKKARYAVDIMWRKEIFIRDNYTCQRCYKRGGDLNAHHILNYSEHIDLQLNVDNGITLCKICHNSFHKEFGRTKNDKEQLNLFIKSFNPSPVIIELN